MRTSIVSEVMSARPRSVTLAAAWHRAHRMPENPTPAQRLKWHQAHAAHCGCRPMPASVRALARQTRAVKSPGRKITR